MKPIWTGSQTVGPFFSIGLSRLCQQTDAHAPAAANTITIQGTLFDGDQKPIPDGVLEFWSKGQFVRVPTNEDGSFSAGLTRPTDCHHFDVLIFMRGLMRPVLTRCYIGNLSELRAEIALQQVPVERLQTLLAQPVGAQQSFGWNIHMQGENETVFFDF